MSVASTAPQSAASRAINLTRKLVVAVFGVTILALGVALIVLPGPAFLVIPLGLTILATEFLWARRLLRRMKEGTTRWFRGRDRSRRRSASLVSSR